MVAPGNTTSIIAGPFAFMCGAALTDNLLKVIVTQLLTDSQILTKKHGSQSFWI
jgi:hypothetical protein